MDSSEGILLKSQYTNKMTVGGELGWFPRDYNASTGYTWKCSVDNSGIYEVVEELTLHPAVSAVGVPGTIYWKLKAIKPGSGSIMFESYPPGGEEPAQRFVVNLEVQSG